MLLRGPYNLEIIISSQLVHNFGRLDNLVFFYFDSMGDSVEIDYKTAYVTFYAWKKLLMGQNLSRNI